MPQSTLNEWQRRVRHQIWLSANHVTKDHTMPIHKTARITDEDDLDILTGLTVEDGTITFTAEDGQEVSLSVEDWNALPVKAVFTIDGKDIALPIEQFNDMIDVVEELAEEDDDRAAASEQAAADAGDDD